jgi:hypothetical protein
VILHECLCPVNAGKNGETREYASCKGGGSLWKTSSNISALSGVTRAYRRLSAELDPEKMNYATTSLVSVYHNCPDGKERYFFVSCVDGAIGDVSVGEGEPPEAEFSISGDYDVFAKMSMGELGAQAALMSGKLKLKGNMVKALKLSVRWLTGSIA